ncbi:hypothetical protein ACH5RR_029100 [Cinchona calisaya]|uniref:Uncharacterized protein n=1 Tax=Cinchona calisaya TaxID=153742 RepID=A0ABD2YQN9_9GENT
MAYHLKPLFMQGHLNGLPVASLMVDNGVAMNVLPANMMKGLGKSIENLIPTDIVLNSYTEGATNTWVIFPVDVTIGSQLYIPSLSHQMLLIWNGDEAEIVKADSKSFMAGVNATEATHYHTEHFVKEGHHQEAFDALETYLVKPPIMMPPDRTK